MQREQIKEEIVDRVREALRELIYSFELLREELRHGHGLVSESGGVYGNGVWNIGWNLGRAIDLMGDFVEHTVMDVLEVFVMADKEEIKAKLEEKRNARAGADPM